MWDSFSFPLVLFLQAKTQFFSLICWKNFGASFGYSVYFSNRSMIVCFWFITFMGYFGTSILEISKFWYVQLHNQSCLWGSNNGIEHVVENICCFQKCICWYSSTIFLIILKRIVGRLSDNHSNLKPWQYIKRSSFIPCSFRSNS